MTDMKKPRGPKDFNKDDAAPRKPYNNMDSNDDFDGGGEGDFGGYDVDKDRKMFAKKKSETPPADSKKPYYQWLVK